jgi:transposase
MRRIRELLRLHYGTGASARAIARELAVSRSTVKDYLARAMAAGVTWPLADELTDGVLEERLFAASGSKPGTRRRAEPDWAALVREMKRPGVNLTVLWEEYGAAHPGGYAYSRFCELYRDFEHRLSPTMRQHHVAGDKVFVDYSGKTVPIVDRGTGEVRPAQLFVAVLGASNYTYAEVSWTQGLQDWIGAHVHMFAFFEGCPRLVVYDYVPGNIIRLLCPPRLCGEFAANI